MLFLAVGWHSLPVIILIDSFRHIWNWYTVYRSNWCHLLSQMFILLLIVATPLFNTLLVISYLLAWAGYGQGILYLSVLNLMMASLHCHLWAILSPFCMWRTVSYVLSQKWITTTDYCIYELEFWALFRDPYVELQMW